MATIKGHLSFQILDGLGVVASTPQYFDIDDTKTLAQIITAAQDYITTMDAMTDGQILGVSLDAGVTLPTVKSAPVAGAEVERGGLFNWGQANVKYRFGLLFPALSQSLIVNGKIDLGSAPVLALISNVTAIGGALDYISTGGNLLLGLTDALITFRKHRKAENRRSFEV